MTEIEIIRAALVNPCIRCRGTRAISVRHSTHSYETDSADEKALNYHDERCPRCALPALAALATVEKRLAEADSEASEHKASFDMRWKADMRAIKRWQEATGRTEVWPDHADLCVWLMERMEQGEALIAEAAKLSSLRSDMPLGAQVAALHVCVGLRAEILNGKELLAGKALTINQLRAELTAAQEREAQAVEALRPITSQAMLLNWPNGVLPKEIRDGIAIVAAFDARRKPNMGHSLSKGGSHE